ncbi:MAG: ACP S-malonyltransferase [Pontiellaceae bacterium]
MSKAIVFPGQGSQIVGMTEDLYKKSSDCRNLFSQANDLLGFDLSSICFHGPQETLNQSNYAQLGIFVSSVALFNYMNKNDSTNDISYLAGHSLGEWTALHIAGTTSFIDTIKILEARGRFMQEACDHENGAMLAVINLESEELINISKKVGCSVANFNSPMQTVLSGRVDSINNAENLAIKNGAKRAIKLPVAGAFHSPLMNLAAEKMNNFLIDFDLKSPRMNVLSNVTGEIHKFSEIRKCMVKQIVSPVRWVDCVKTLSNNGVSEIIECGPGKVLTGLVKRIDKNLKVRNISQISDIN